MAFQDNSGDIILDVVLTDEGRRRLALGNGQFSIEKFALGDDEINYGLFDTTAATATQDLSILQTPVLEAFTNNTSLMKSRLLSLDNQNLFYLPILKLNTQIPGTATYSTDGNFVVAVNQATYDDSGDDNAGRSIGIGTNGAAKAGFLYGVDDSGEQAGKIVVDAGINSTNITEIAEELIETQFIVQMDHRLGTLMPAAGGPSPSPTVDDDYVATYILNAVDGSSFVSSPSQPGGFEAAGTPIDGPVSTRLSFKIRSTQDLRTSNFLFTRLGSTTSNYTNRSGASQEVKYIDSMIRISGRTTGYSIEIPVRYVKV